MEADQNGSESVTMEETVQGREVGNNDNIETRTPTKPETAAGPQFQNLHARQTSTPVSRSTQSTSSPRTVGEDVDEPRPSTSESSRGKTAVSKQWLAKLLDFSAERSRSPGSGQGLFPSPGDNRDPETDANVPRPSPDDPPAEAMNDGQSDEQGRNGNLQHPGNIQGKIMALRHFDGLMQNGDLLGHRDEPEVGAGNVSRWIRNPSLLYQSSTPQVKALLGDISNLIEDNRDDHPDMCGRLGELIASRLNDHQGNEAPCEVSQSLMRSFVEETARRLQESQDNYYLVISLLMETVSRAQEGSEEAQRQALEERQNAEKRERERMIQEIQEKWNNLKNEEGAASMAVNKRRSRKRKLKLRLDCASKRVKEAKEWEKRIKKRMAQFKLKHAGIIDDYHDGSGVNQGEDTDGVAAANWSNNDIHDENPEDMGSSANSRDELPLGDDTNAEEEVITQSWTGKPPRSYLNNYATTPFNPSSSTFNPMGGDGALNNIYEDITDDDEGVPDLELQEGLADVEPEDLMEDEAQEGAETSDEEQELIEPRPASAARGKGEKTKGEKVADRYKASLSRLTRNNRRIIGELMMEARNEMEHAALVAAVIEDRLLEVGADMMLPLMYLIDSICVNVGHPYTGLFLENIAANFSYVYREASPAVRGLMYDMRQTWGKRPNVFTTYRLNEIDLEMRDIDPTWPVSEEAFRQEAGDDEDPIVIGSSTDQDDDADDEEEDKGRKDHSNNTTGSGDAGSAKEVSEGRNPGVFIRTEDDGSIDVSTSSDESLDDDEEEDGAGPSSSLQNCQSNSFGTPAKRGASSTKKRVPRKPTKGKKRVIKKVARRKKTQWTSEVKREAVSAWKYMVKHPNEFKWKKGSRVNEGYSRVARLMDKYKSRGKKTSQWQGRCPASTLRNWVSAYFKAHPQEEKPEGLNLMQTSITWTFGDVDEKPPAWAFYPDPAYGGEQAQEQAQEQVQEQAQEQAHAEPSAEPSDESPLRRDAAPPKKDNKSSTKKGKKKKARDLSEARDQSYRYRGTRTRHASPTLERATAGEDPSGSNDAPSQSDFVRVLGLGAQRDPIRTRHRSQAEAAIVSSPPPELSPQVTGEPYSARSPSGGPPELQREGTRYEGDDLSNSSEVEENILAWSHLNGLDNHGHDDYSADGFPEVDAAKAPTKKSDEKLPEIIPFTKEHNPKNQKRKRGESKKAPTATNLPPPDPPKRRRRSGPTNPPNSMQDDRTGNQLPLASVAHANAVAASDESHSTTASTSAEISQVGAAMDNLVPQPGEATHNHDDGERIKLEDSEQAGPSHSVAATVKVKADAHQPEEQGEKMEENNEALEFGFLHDPITNREILQELTQEEYNTVLEIARVTFGIELPNNDRDAALGEFTALWETTRNYPSALLTRLHRSVMERLREQRLNNQAEANEQENAQPLPEVEDEEKEEVMSRLTPIWSSIYYLQDE